MKAEYFRKTNIVFIVVNTFVRILKETRMGIN